MAKNGGRRDLAAMLQPLVRSLIAAELPVLASHGISMWGYVVLSALDDGPVRTQGALATAIGQSGLVFTNIGYQHPKVVA
ncbi:hypothetical protein ACWCOW_41515, partial [Streptomyces sp. NPDC001939]